VGSRQFERTCLDTCGWDIGFSESAKTLVFPLERHAGQYGRCSTGWNSGDISTSSEC
jgi:hypothetical protein